MGRARDFYYLLFYTAYRAQLFERDKLANRWRALVVVSLLQFFALATLTLWIEFFFKGATPLAPNKVQAAIAFAALLVINYLALLRFDQWESYASRFAAYAPRDRRLRVGATAALMAVVFASFLSSVCTLAAMRQKGVESPEPMPSAHAR